MNCKAERESVKPYDLRKKLTVVPRIQNNSEQTISGGKRKGGTNRKNYRTKKDKSLKNHANDFLVYLP